MDAIDLHDHHVRSWLAYMRGYWEHTFHLPKDAPFPDIDLVTYTPPKPPGFVGPMRQVTLKRGEDCFVRYANEQFHEPVVVYCADPVILNHLRGEFPNQHPVFLSMDPGAGRDATAILDVRIENGVIVLDGTRLFSGKSFEFDASQLPKLLRYELESEQPRNRRERRSKGKITDSKYKRGEWWNR
jgi:hypothetical protein